MIKKRLLTFGMVALLTISLIGCGGKKDEDAAAGPAGSLSKPDQVINTQPDATPDNGTDNTTDDSVDDLPVQEMDYEEAFAIYEDILDRAYAVLASNGNIDQEIVIDGLSGVVEASWYTDNALNRVGYSIQDITDDGIPELILAINPTEGHNEYYDRDIYAIFTIVYGKPLLTVEGWARNSIHILEDGTFFHEGSGGAAYYCFGNYSISRDGSVVEWKDFYFTEPIDENWSDVAFYHNTTGVWDSAEAEKLKISETDFYALSEKYVDQIEVLNVMPFADYAYDGPYVIGAGENQDTSDIYLMSEEEVMNGEWPEYYYYYADEEPMTALGMGVYGEVYAFTVDKLTYDGIDENGNMTFTSEEIMRMDTFGDEPLLLYFTMAGDIPNYGITYVDMFDNIRRFAICESGYDGSLFLMEYWY